MFDSEMLRWEVQFEGTVSMPMVAMRAPPT